MNFKLSDLSMLQAFFLLYVLVYGAMIFLLWLAWRNSGRRKAFTVDGLDNLKVALVVPFRNERANLAQMAYQTFAAIEADWEVIWVDDHSEDGSLQFLQDFIQKHAICSWQLIQSEGIGKKPALEAGIKASHADLIVTTDADVLFAGNPFGLLVEAFAEQQVQLAAGPVMSASAAGWFAKFQQAEWASIQLVTGASFHLGTPLMCSGANLCFRRAAFFEVGGYVGNFQHLSGDDEFLLKKIIAHFGKESVVFVSKPDALVQTKPFRSWDELIAQRERWASKWRLHGNFGHVFGSFLGFFLPVCFLFSPFLLATGAAGYWIFAFVWVVKLIGEGLVLSAILRAYRQPCCWSDVLWVGILHPFFVAQVALGAFRGNFTWKGRKSGLFH
ncbi:glycosyltransferase [Lunatimonas salinarum]|uniref:glycosyltransferase n=1 Tax=Lunatimonas salinarum TaxID=1774590 RepID=UPI001AE05065|nr:glycosyltransferase [Lunatimonas salinarum]